MIAAARAFARSIVLILGAVLATAAVAQEGVPGGRPAAAGGACGEPVAFDFPLPGATVDRTARRSGGIVGAMQNVADQIAAVGGGEAGRSVRVTVTPRVERQTGGVRLSLDVGPAPYTMPGDAKPEEAEAARRRIAQLLAGLRSWSRILTESEFATLTRDGSGVVEAREPFVPVQAAGAGGPAGPQGVAVRVCRPPAAGGSATAAAREEKPRQYHVARLVLDDGPWRARNEQLQSNVRLARGDRERAEEGLRRAIAYLERKKEEAEAAKEILLASRGARDRADEALSAFTPEPSRTTPDYRALVHALEVDTRALDGLWEEIAAARAAGRPVPDDKLDAYERIRRRIDTEEARLAKLNETLGFDRDRKALEAAAIEATAVAWQRNTQYVAAIDIVARARSEQGTAFDKVDDAEAALAAAEKEASLFGADAPLIAGVTLYAPGLRYAVEVWDPSEAIAFLDARITALRRQLSEASLKQIALRGAHAQGQATAVARLRDLQHGIMESAIAQGTIELGFMVRDVVEKFVEAGPVGALAEGTKKVLEAWAFGPPTFKEYTIPNDPKVEVPLSPSLDQARADLGKVAGKRAFSGFVSGQTSSAIVAVYIKARDLRIVREAFHDPATTAEELTEAFEKFLKAEKDVVSARGKFVLKDFWGPIAEKGLKGGIADVWKQARDPVKPHRAGKVAAALARDVAKQGLKTAVAAVLEGMPLQAYLAAEIDAQLATRTFLASSAAYWDVHDRREGRLADRREIIRQYDPRNHMRIASDDPFDDGAMATIEIADPHPARRRFAVTLGGKEAAADAGGRRTTFRVPAKDLSADGTGGVELKIVILE